MNSLTEQILKARGPRNPTDPWRPWLFFSEAEFSADRCLDDVATIFLTNRECPFRCLMCDLWKNTTLETVPPGAIPAQIDYALSRLATCAHLKLYNSANFFDPKSVPYGDWPAIAKRAGEFQTVIVENHPRFCNSRCARFQQMSGTQLEVAIGLESSHPPTLAMLNKQMTIADFAEACRSLLQDQIRLRAFILLKPPRTSEAEGIDRAIESVRFAFDCGVSCCSIIPVRAGNGSMEQLQLAGEFTPPKLSSLERVLRETLAWNRGRVFADLWDAHLFADNPLDAHGTAEQLARLTQMNRTQLPG